MHLPAKYGSWKGVYTRLRNWAIDGTSERVFSALLAQTDAEGDLDWVVSVDSTIVRAHQNAAGAAKGDPGRRARPPRHQTLARRTHYGFVWLPTGLCHRLCSHLTPGQVGGVPGCEQVMASIRFPNWSAGHEFALLSFSPTGPTRPRRSATTCEFVASAQ